MFNALRYSKDLEAAAFLRQQAEAAIDVFYKFMEYNFATKDDISKIHTDVTSLRQKIHSDISSLRQEVRSDITSLKNEIHTEIALLKQESLHSFQSMEYKMTIKFGLMQTAGIALLAGLIKFF